MAVDIGGTFTDVVLHGSAGELAVDKVLTTHDDLLKGLFEAVDRALARKGLGGREVDGVFVHATTIVTNALIEKKGAPTALITTKGFADVLAIRNEHRYDMYDPQIEFAPPLIPRELTFELDERTLADGTVLKKIDAAAVEAIAAALRREGVASVGVCLLNSYRNPANERAVEAALAERSPGLFVSLSSQVAPQIREYPRAATTAVNAYARPITEPYLDGLAERLAGSGVRHRPLIMLSSGGTIGAKIAGRNPVRMIESGPAAGALAAAWRAERLGLARLLSFDMGGTTAKACLIENGAPLVAGEFEVDRMYRFKEGSGIPLTVPSIDMIEIGAGGGSIARVDELGLLKVGPASAGSSPGPACYGLGGEEATVTDADLVLGLLDEGNFLGGEMRLDIEAAKAAMARLAARLAVDPIAAARGIYRVVAEAMAGAARAHAADRGLDHRGLPLLAFGGAGPVHACEVGALLESAQVIFPPLASVLSAFGTLVTPIRMDLVRSVVGRLDELDWDEVSALLSEMAEEGLDALEKAGEARGGARLSFGADMRYFGQQNELSVVFTDDPRSARRSAPIAAAFEAAYLAKYGINPSHVPIEMVNWRLAARGSEVAAPAAQSMSASAAEPKAYRPVWLWEGAERVPVYDRLALCRGQALAGPTIVEERETTIIIPPGWRAEVDAEGCISATRAP
ncbi:MAG: hydantoinase/oxoprolinase family protein [Caulobacteraceae bacterium]